MQPQPVKSFLIIILRTVAVAGLILTLVPSILSWQGVTGPQQVNNLMFAGTILWFASASFLFVKKRD